MKNERLKLTSFERFPEKLGTSLEQFRRKVSFIKGGDLKLIILYR